MKDPRDVIIKPVVSEKSYALLDAGRLHVPRPPRRQQDRDPPRGRERSSTSGCVKVNTLNRPGKRKRNRRSFTFGKKPDTKRAIVTLHAGDRIDLFES